MKKSLNFRLLVWAGTSIFVVVCFVTGYSALVLKKELLKTATLESQKFAENVAFETTSKISHAFDVVDTLGHVLGEVKNKNHPIKFTRDEALRLMENRFKANPSMFGVWTGWEPNAFDNQDEANKNKSPSDATGRFVPYLTRKSNGEINLEALLDYDKEGVGSFYQLPKKYLKSVVIPPYSYVVDNKNVLFISLATPIVADGIFQGVVGVDFDLSFFEKLTDASSLPKGSKIIIYDTQGTIVGFSEKNEMLMKNIFQEKIDNYDSYTKERLDSKEKVIVLGDHNLSVLSKIKIVDEEWFVEVIIPRDVIIGAIYKEIIIQAMIALVASMFALIVGYFLIRKITGRIISLADRLKSSAQVTRDGSNTVKDASFQVSSATQEQAAAIQETATTLDEISSMVFKSVENARNSSEDANNSFVIAEAGKKTVELMRNTMEEIREINKDIVDQVERSNNEIGGIVAVINNISEKTKVINDIVFQTKLLSFNASVEAARAGEHGKGFAIVAEEVGNLASMSGHSSKEINELLEQSISSVENTIRETKEKVTVLISNGQQKVNEGVSVAEKCEEILNQIVVNVSSVKTSMLDVSIAAEEQSKGVQNISDAMNMLDKTTQDNTKTVHQTATQSEKLFEEADNLSEIILELEEEVYGKRIAS